MTATRTSAITLSLVGIALLASACPGSIDNPDDFPELPECTDDDFNAEELFATSCGTSSCHDGADPTRGNLDLISPGVFERLEGVASHECGDFLRVDPAEPDNSFLFLKITGRQGPGCGQRMPQVSFLTNTQISCLQRWIRLNVADLNDAGTDAARDAGSDTATDAEDDATVDAAEDAPEDMMSMDAPMDAGPVDCSGIAEAGFELCETTENGCTAETVAGSGCDDVCMAAGMVCTQAIDDATPDCGPADGVEPFPDCSADRGSMHEFCTCERE